MSFMQIANSQEQQIPRCARVTLSCDREFPWSTVALALSVEGACPCGTVLALSQSAVTFPKQDAHTSFAVPYAKA
jgi:hypothetical protein